MKELYPYEHVKSVFDIDYCKLYDMGYRGILFDIDNTLVHHGDDSTEEVDNLIREVQSMGFKTLLLTNNDEARVKRFVKNMDTLYICEAGKPDVASYYKAIEMLQLEKKEVVAIGDQLFMDIRGANRSGLASILVDFIVANPKAPIGKTRQVEKMILKLYRWSKSCQYRLGNIQKKKEVE